MKTATMIEEEKAKIKGLVCPRCKSKRTTFSRGKDSYLIGLLSIVFGCMLILIPIIGFLLIFGGIGHLVLIAPFAKDSYFCRDCKLSWKPGEIPFAE